MTIDTSTTITAPLSEIPELVRPENTRHDPAIAEYRHSGGPHVTPFAPARAL
jgi:hypothetical protein